MRTSTRATIGAVALLLLLTTGPTTPVIHAARSTAAAAHAADEPPAKCCFTNPGYAGVCAVQPSKDEACGQILDYLNNPLAQGKGYCGNTTIRGGWRQTSCENK
jgi:hypothetical protein